MAKKKSTMASRAWQRLRLTLLWARKGGSFRQSLVFSSRIFSGSLKALKPDGRRADRLKYGEREFSFPDTPVFQFKTPSMRIPRIPCINPRFEHDNDGDGHFYFRREGGEKFLTDSAGNDIYVVSASPWHDDNDHAHIDIDNHHHNSNHGDPLDCGFEDEEIDLKAEEFIAKFHTLMKLQRQLSSNQYNEMLQRGIRYKNGDECA